MKTRHQEIIKRLVEVITKNGEKITTQQLVKFVNRNFSQYRVLGNEEIEKLVTVIIYS